MERKALEDMTALEHLGELLEDIADLPAKRDELIASRGLNRVEWLEEGNLGVMEDLQEEMGDESWWADNMPAAE